MSDQVQISYKERAAFYAVEYVDDVDASFILSLVDDKTANILEIPCGVGRNVINLAKTGRKIVAADIEPQMVQELTMRSKRAGIGNIQAVVADLTDPSLGQEFDLIVVPREAFQLVTKPTDALKSLVALRRHLSSHGRLMIDLSTFKVVRPEQAGLQPDYFDAALPDGIWIDEWTRFTPTGSSLSRQRIQSRNGDGTIGVTFRYSNPDDSEVLAKEASIRMRVYSKDEFEKLCGEAGLHIEAVLGDYSWSPYRAGDARIIFILSSDAHDKNTEETTPPSGVLWDVIKNFSNERDSFLTRNIGSVGQRPDVRNYFETYLAEYFAGPFLEGYGAEQILDMMSNWAGNGSALDLGAGTTSLFWYLPATRIDQVSCCDIAPEALAVLDEFVRKRPILPECYQWVADRFELTDQQVSKVRKLFAEYLVFDCIEAWPSWMEHTSYDLITAFGNFGISRDLSTYQRCFDHLVTHLRPGGRAIGADWARRPSFVVKDSHDNSYLSVESITKSLVNVGLEPLACTRIELAHDPLYEAVFVWGGRLN